MASKTRKKKGFQGAPKVPLVFVESPLDSSMPYPEGPRNGETCEVERVPFTEGSKWVLLQFDSLDVLPVAKRATRTKSQKSTVTTSKRHERKPRRRNFVPIEVRRESPGQWKCSSHPAKSEFHFEHLPAETVSSAGATCSSPPPDISTPDVAQFDPASPSAHSTPELSVSGRGSSLHVASEESPDLLEKARVRLLRCLGFGGGGLTAEREEQQQQEEMATVLAPDTPEHEYGMTNKCRQLRKIRRAGRFVSGKIESLDRSNGSRIDK